MSHKKIISAVIACYNDGQAIPIMHERLTKVFNKIGCDYEIIFVNDGSPDDSESVLRKICEIDKKTTTIIHSRNFSSQNALISGISQSIGDAVVLLDGDLQDPPELIENFYNKWLEGFDVVYGIRTKREASIIMQIFSKLFYRLFKLLSYINVPHDAGDFSLIDKKVADVLVEMPERDIFFRGLRAWAGFRQTGIEYVRPERMFGKSTNNLIKYFKWAKKGIFSFSFQPLEWISILSLLIVFLSFVALIIFTLSYVFNWLPRGMAGIQTIITLVLFIGGIQLLSISIIGEYIAKIFEEVKGRPKFIIKEIINDHRDNYKKLYQTFTQNKE
jgi:polyisoprenyl-phosphate glycosyltransferase